MFALPTPVTVEVAKEKRKKPAKLKRKIDPQFVSAARELRDRYLEQVNENGYRLESAGKYDVVRSIGTTQTNTPPIRLLDAA